MDLPADLVSGFFLSIFSTEGCLFCVVNTLLAAADIVAISDDGMASSNLTLRKKQNPRSRRPRVFCLLSYPIGYGFLCVDNAINCMFCLQLDEQFSKITGRTRRSFAF